MRDKLGQHAAQTIAAGSKSFATAAKLFDPATRRSAMMLYAWCRHCDDVIDDQQLGFPAQETYDAHEAHEAHEARSESSEARLNELRDLTRRAYAGEPMQSPAFAAFQEVALRHGIPECYPQAHLDGFAMDVAQRRYVTIDDTVDYCYHVAGVVGVMMAWIMGARDEATLDRACDLGLAFQLTNIARDIIEDAQIGRCYLPEQWLEEAGIARQEITAPQHREALARMARQLIDLAEPYYDSAQGGLSALPPRCAWAIATARGVYREIGIKVKAHGARAWDSRISTTRLDKARLLGQGLAQAVASRWYRPVPRSGGLWQRPA
ncbi:phytoene/squalene synthase family protein [Microbulbifer salipaludis]|uniref:Phytoene/squalene synthase family protein n=1 Tax=Microbulbifer salipaludis TaxID=187980 RepID=A0ABS3E9I3_9GAMM|nr:15-cis-phytoene synthase CrtB [Microbulbifer salipaludis]MBN8431714.1 phytoene/squalene synthase family protein [Microbulbifer salipaludis]